MRGHHKKRTMKTREEIAKEAENHRNWAGPKKSSMKRRCNQHDYRDRGIYMVTLCLEGRLPLLGTLEGDPTVKDGEGRAHIVLSPLGRKVKECWESIPKFHPVVEPMKLCIMPDHIHGLLFVHEKMKKHLGNVIWGFKTGCRKAARELGFLTTLSPHCGRPQPRHTLGERLQRPPVKGERAVRPHGCIYGRQPTPPTVETSLPKVLHAPW